MSHKKKKVLLNWRRVKGLNAVSLARRMCGPSFKVYTLQLCFVLLTLRSEQML